MEKLLQKTLDALCLLFFLHLQCKSGDVIGIKESKASKKLVEGNIEFPGLANVPPHLDLDKPKLTGKISDAIESG